MKLRCEVYIISFLSVQGSSTIERTGLERTTTLNRIFTMYLHNTALQIERAYRLSSVTKSRKTATSPSISPPKIFFRTNGRRKRQLRHVLGCITPLRPVLTLSGHLSTSMGTLDCIIYLYQSGRRLMCLM